MQSFKLTVKQSRFIREYLVDGNGTAAAVRAGYSQKTARAIAAENLTKPAIQAVLQARQDADSERLGVTRDKVIQGLLEAVNQAREQSNPMAMISAWRELGRLMGYYAPARVDVGVRAGDGVEQFERMSNEELMAIVQAGGGAAVVT